MLVPPHFLLLMYHRVKYVVLLATLAMNAIYAYLLMIMTKLTMLKRGIIFQTLIIPDSGIIQIFPITILHLIPFFNQQLEHPLVFKIFKIKGFTIALKNPTWKRCWEILC